MSEVKPLDPKVFKPTIAQEVLTTVAGIKNGDPATQVDKPKPEPFIANAHIDYEDPPVYRYANYDDDKPVK